MLNALDESEKISKCVFCVLLSLVFLSFIQHVFCTLLFDFFPFSNKLKV
jgi:hypothetical protein